MEYGLPFLLRRRRNCGQHQGQTLRVDCRLDRLDLRQRGRNGIIDIKIYCRLYPYYIYTRQCSTVYTYINIQKMSIAYVYIHIYIHVYIYIYISNCGWVYNSIYVERETWIGNRLSNNYIIDWFQWFQIYWSRTQGPPWDHWWFGTRTSP